MRFLSRAQPEEAISYDEVVQTPLPVMAAGTILLLMLAWRCVVIVFPAFQAADPRVSAELLNVVLPIFVVWGLFTLRRWAWFLGLVGSVAGFVLPVLLLSGFVELQVGAFFPDATLGVQQLVVLEAVSFVIFALLLSRTSRHAFF